MVSGAEKNINGGIIYWGRIEGTLNGYNIYFYPNGRTFIFHSDINFKDSTNTKARKTITAKDPYNDDNFNRYTIRKYEDKYYVFINGLFYKKLNAVPLTGKVIGLGSSYNATTIFDDISISILMS